MPASGPAYLRSGDEAPPNYPPTYQPAPESEEHEEGRLHVTGLREKRLVLLFIVLLILTILTIAVLLLNIFIIRALGMSSRGMNLLQFHSRRNPKTGEEESVLQFLADKVHLGKVVARSGIVHGSSGKDLNVYASRVILSGGKNRSRVLLQDGICRIEKIDQFIVKGAERPYFSAQHPLFTVDNRIKKIIAEKIITNKIRSPINENLNIDVNNLIIRGNEGVRIESKRLNATADKRVRFQTSKDGRLSFASSRIFFGSSWLTLPLSTSPALTASSDGHRVCICATLRPRLFLVPSNRPCIATYNICS